ncbi:MAG: cadherin-like domain-containing protein, partial [Pseudohongiellaceae bacterium]
MNSRGFYIALEQRILLDAAGVATAVETLPDHIDTAVAAAEDAQEQEAVQGLLNAFAEQPSEQGSSGTNSLIFIDSRVENPEQLLGNSLDKSAEIYMIDADSDGLAFIADILNQYEGKVDSLHIISHGNSGELLLGNKHLTSDSLSGEDGQYLAMMSERLDNEADILFYACNVAEGKEGKRFVEQFALITGADVAASTDLTGSVALGGDAELEYSTGNIEAQQVISVTSLSNYSELLGTPDAGGNVTLTNVSGGATSITEDASAPGSANVRLTPTTLNDGANPTPTEVRVTSITGGTLTQSDGSAIVVGAAGTKLTLTGGNYDFRFTPDANRDTDVTFTYAVVESGGETNSADSTATISVTAVNDAPTASNVTLPNVDEDTTSPTGTTVSSLFGGANFNDVDTGSSIGGILVVGNTADLLSQGTWEYSTDGTNFFGMGTVADNGTALALSASTQLRFVPAADYNGAPPALTVRVVDNTVSDFTSGGARVTTDSSSNGAATGIAAATTTVGVTVSAVNDTPTLTEGGEFTAILEDQSPNNGVTVSTFLNGLVSDIDNNSSDIGLAITGTDVSSMTGSGSDWQYSTNGGTDWTNVGTVSNTSALLLSPSHLIRFTPAEDQAGSGTLTYKAWDGSTGTGGAKENLTSGDSNRVSTDSFTSEIAVTPVNDDPVRSGGTKTIEENTTYVLQTADLAYTAKSGAPNEQSADQIIYQLTTLAGKGNVQKLFGSTWATLSNGGLFSQSDIDSGNVRYVHTGAELSANDTDSFVFTVRDGAGAEVTNQNFNFTITNVNAPLSLTDTTITVNEFIDAGDVNVINIGAKDDDNSDTSQIQFTLKSLPNAGLGKLEIDKGAGFVDAAVNDTFTKADLDSGKFRYVHNGTEPVGANASTTFTVDATDNSPAGINTAGNPSPSTVTNETITLNITSRNDAPEKAVAVPTIPEGGTLVIDENFIDFTDPDSPSTQFTIILDTVPTKGALFLDGVRLGVGSMFLRSDLVADKIEYRHFDSNPDADTSTIDDSFNYTMRDRDGATISETQNIKVTPNDADSGGDTSSGVGANNDGEAVLAEGGTHTITDANLARTNTGTTYTLSALPSNGTLKLNGTDLDLGANNSFTATDITNGNLTYVHDDTENFTDTFTFKADGGADNTFNLAITPVNEAPVINTPDGTNAVTISVVEHDDTSTAYVANTQNLDNLENAVILTTTELSGSDIDLPEDSSLFYEVTGKPPGGELMIWNGSAYESLTKDRFTVQDVKDGKVAYFHTAGKEPDAANDKFTVKLTDGGATDSAPRTINIAVTDSNDAPSTQGTTFTITEGATQNLASILNGRFTDSDATDTPDNLTLELTAIPNASAGKIQDYSGGGAGVTLIVGSTFTKADLDAGHIRYEHAGGEFFTDNFSFKAKDNGSPSLESSPDQVNILIRPVNDDPVVGNNKGIVSGDNRYENETFTITSAQLSSTDGDHDSTPTASQLKQIQYRVTSDVTAGTLTLNGKVLGAGSVFTQADVNNGLLKYQHTKEGTLTDAFSFKVSDAGGGNEPTGTFNITLNPINDSPELVVGNAVTLLEEGVKTITGVSISDVDAGSDDVVTTLTVTKGTVTFANTSLGGAVVAIAGDGKSLTITGTVAETNTMLGQGIQYTGAANEVGADTLSINVNDQGKTGTDPGDAALSGRTISDSPNTGTATDQQADGTIGITIKPVNDAPTIGAFTNSETILEDASLTLGNLSFADVDAATGNVSVTLESVSTSTTGGKVTVNGDLSSVTVSGNASGKVTITGTLAQVNAVLNTAGSITYEAKDNFNGSDTLRATISDLGNTGAGGAKSATKDVAITITPVNDAPDVSTPVSVSGNEDTDITVKLEAASLDISGNPNSAATHFTVTTLPNAAQGVLYKSDGTTLVVKDALLTKAEAETLVFKPVTNSHANATFAYTAFDGLLTSAIQTGTITVNAVNDKPTLSVVSSGVTYQEGGGLGVAGTAVDLTTGAVSVSDIELVTTSEDNFNSSQLEIDRSGNGTNSNDVFTIDTVTNTDITLSNGSNNGSEVRVNGVYIGDITKNSNGQLRVTFKTAAAQTDVNTVAQAVYYQNTDDSPPANVSLDVKFKDGN